MPNFGLIRLGIWPPGGVSRKHKTAISEVTMTVRVTKLWLYVYLVGLHYMSFGFLIWPTFQGHRGQSSKFHRQVAHFITIWPRELWLGVMMYLGTHCVPKFGLIGLRIWPPGGGSLKRKSAISEVTLTARITKLWLYVYLVGLHYISCRFLIWPTFQGHRGQSSKFHRRVAHFVTIWPREL